MNEQSKFEEWWKYKYKGFYSNGADKRTDFTDYDLKECWDDATKAERKRLDDVWYEVTKKQLSDKDKIISDIQSHADNLGKRYIDACKGSAKKTQEIAALRGCLEWYAEKCRSLNAYCNAKPPKDNAVEALMIEMMLDNGSRAKATIDQFGNPTKLLKGE